MQTQASTAPVRSPGAAIVVGALIRGLRPDPRIKVSEWAARHRRVPVETSQFPGRWSNATAPYLTEIMDVCGADHPAERVTIKKSAQVGYSEALLNIIGATIDVAPRAIMVVHPTVEAGKNWVAEKLDSTIAATPALRSKVRGIVSRDGTGSTSKRKRFPAGYLIVTGANSTRELRQRSIPCLLKDDWSDWPSDVDGQGDPDKMAEARTLGFQSSGGVKIVQGSTPTIAGACRVSAAYARSDRRVFKVPCPHCEWEQELRFFPDEKGHGGLRFNTTGARDVHYECEACGHRIEQSHKREMVSAGRWVATNPEGTHPGFHISSLYSPFTTWDRIVDRFLEAHDQPALLKVFYNVDLGLEWEARGQAPDWKHLQRRAEDYPLGRVPPGGLLITCGVDVQQNGLYYEVVAWGRRGESWSIGAGFLIGDTSDRAGAAWEALDTLYREEFPIADGVSVPVDLMAIDAGYNTDAVCDFVRTRHRAMAVKGRDGWERAVFGQASRQDVTFYGQIKKTRSAKIWPVYVWNMKSELYGNLAKQQDEASGAFPAGYCHFSTGLPDAYFQQLTSESRKEVERNGRLRTEWVRSGPNHWHDCRVYAMAAFFRLAQGWGLNAANAEPAWQKLEAARRPARPQGELQLDAETGAPTPIVGAATPETAPQHHPSQRPLWKRPVRRPGGFVNSWRN